ncbi:MAG: ABC transporter permease subunit [Actinophytocola sp.]|nr:ABC transporter permease subunit [Actinophytocola sp.]
MDWDWLTSNRALITDLLTQHVYLALVPVALGLALALPIGFLTARFARLYPPMLAASAVLYSIPSIALFIVFPGILGTQILDPINIVVALTIYAGALLVRSVADGLRSVSDQVRQSATAVGYERWRRVLKIELPIALPFIFAGLRFVTVANISMVSVGALIGIGGLGQLFTDGFQRSFFTPIIVGMVLSVLLALCADIAIVTTQRFLTPWTRAGRTT